MADLKIDKNRYTVDSVYQWDINQELKIYGLSMLAPEIHFTNEATGGSIVVDCTVDESGVISVNIPNSLLQYKYPIVVYVAGFEGDTYKTYHKFSIPVKARKRPGDYTLSLSDNEVYSFTNMERRIANIEDEIKSEGSIVYSYSYDDENTKLVESSGQKSIGEYIPLVSSSLQAIKSLSDKFKTMIDANTKLGDTALSIAKGINSAKVFDTTADMETWLSDENNKGKCQVGNNLYIVALEVPDWWISEVLEEPDSETGFYYKIAQLEVQKVDLTTINEDIDVLQSDVETLEDDVDTLEINVDELKDKVVMNYPTTIIECKDEIKEGLTLPVNTSFPLTGVCEGNLHYLVDKKHYRLTDDGWEELTGFSQALSGSGVPYVFYKDEIYLLSWHNGSYYVNYYTKWNKTDGWLSTALSTPQNFGLGKGVVYEDEIHALGGYNGINSTVQRYHYKLDKETNTWVNVSTLPFENMYIALVYRNEIHILGEYNHYKWNKTDGWIKLANVPFYISGGGYKGVVYNDKIIVKYGSNVEYYYNGIEWIKKGPKLGAITNGTSLEVLGDSVHMLGENNKHSIYTDGKWIKGYIEKNNKIYVPGTSVAQTDNLEKADNGYLVTADGEIKIQIYE